MTRIFISNNPEALKEKLSEYKNTATVEAEYGDTVVEGTIKTLAHHGPRSKNPCPCLEPNYEGPEIEAIGVSHADADTLGGLRALIGYRDNEDDPAYPNYWFWQMMAKVDVRGPHHLYAIIQECLEESKYKSIITNILKEYLYMTAHAFWAWSNNNRMFSPRDGSVQDITDYVYNAQTVITEILEHDVDRIECGKTWKTAQDSLDKDSFVKTFESKDVIVTLRTSESFTNHLYDVHKDKKYFAVVSSNLKLNTVTVSIADPITGFSCGKFVQKLWGPDAGGHSGIGGSPRGGFIDQTKCVAEALRAAAILLKDLQKITDNES